MRAEVSIENHLKRAVKAAGGRCLKLPAIWYAGIPDRLVLLPGGRVWFIELKKPKAQTTRHVKPRQTAWAVFLQNNGFNYARLVGIEEVEGFVNEHLENTV